MKKNIYTAYIILIASAFITLIPFNSVSAAVVYLESSRNNISVGDTVIVDVKINAEGTTINTVDGNIAIKFSSSSRSVVAQEFSLANSAFGLWPRTPSLSKDGQIISFIGGVPGGFNIEGATLFKIIFQAKKEGVVTIVPQNMVVFSNDGKGTKIPVKIRDLVFNVVPKKTGTTPNDEWSALIAQDITPPEDFIVVLGQDPAMFEGKKFAYFSAVDNQTGIAYYEVSENGAPIIRSGSTYVFQNQDEKDVKLNVTAFDKAGNKKFESYPGKSNKGNINWSAIIIVLAVIIVARVLYKKMRKNKKNASLSL